MTSSPIIKGVAQIIIDHQERLAVLDPKRLGFGLNCSCGKNFPPRIPDDWVPEGYTAEEWVCADEEERDNIISGNLIKAKTAARDFYEHVAQVIIDYLYLKENSRVLLPKPPRKKYRFIGRSGDRYVWQAHVRGDSRAQEIRCGVSWFWGGKKSEDLAR